MTKSKSNLIKYVGAPLMALSIVMGSKKINAQTKSFQKIPTKKESQEIQRGLQAPTLQRGAAPGYLLFKSKISPKLKSFLKNTKEISFYSTNKDVVLKMDPDTSDVNILYPTKLLNNGVGEAVGIFLKSDVDVDLCKVKTGIGSKLHNDAGFYFQPNLLNPKYNNYFPSLSDSLFNKIGDLEKAVSEVDSVTRSNSTKLDKITSRQARNWNAYKKAMQNQKNKKKHFKKETKENEGQKRLNIITSGLMNSPRYFNTEIQYDAVQGKGISFGPFASFSLGNGETNVTEDTRFKEVTSWGTNSSKERKDVYQTESLTKYLGSLGARATKNIGNFYSFLELGVDVVKDRLKTFGTAYVNYFRDGEKLKATNKVPISNSASERNVYRFPIKGSLGLGLDINDFLSAEGKVSKELNQDGKLEGYAGLSVRF